MSRLVWVPLAALLAGAVTFAALSLGDGDRREPPGLEARPTLAAVAAEPERYRGQRVSIVGTVRRTGPGRFVVERGRLQVLVVPGLRERAVRVDAGDRVRVTGTVRVIDRSTPYDQADPIPDFDGRAALVPGRVETLDARPGPTGPVAGAHECSSTDDRPGTTATVDLRALCMTEIDPGRHP